MARRVLKPEATLKLGINGKTLVGEKWASGWVLSCPDYPDIAEKYLGAADASPAIDEFTRRATGTPEAA